MADYQTRAAVRAMQEIAQAQADVAPVVGSLPAMDSAAGVYGAALKQMGVSDKDVRATSITTASARLMFQMMRDRNRGSGRPMVAMDAATEKDFLERFPHANRLKRSF